ncbi:hypothetical protein QFZ75_005027 [Streptomyces sp. V3I8]|uniref:hypothetical protein n=1 Tax=Streptomyces sp. V3I8 TaxID=3042279 RepID=UPI0027879175|nr:hypothetical protein [Streptomyces sp. V3I8]MDQ1038611.1 hypothetical protein [Streptomyces sp. V3I8]
MYRCNSGYIPCDPQEEARWCQHEETLCGIIAQGDEFGAAMKQLWGVSKELGGVGEYQTCLEDKDFEHCSSFAVDAFIGGKFKILEKVYDELKLLKRGCRIVSKTSLATAARAGFTTTAVVASGGVPCGEHNVPGLPRSTDEIENSGGCDVCAENIKKSLGGGKIVHIKPVDEMYLPKYRGVDSGWQFHVVVVLNDRVYDAWTGRAGDSVAEYKAQWARHHLIDFGF